MTGMADHVTIEIAFGQDPYNIDWALAADVTTKLRSVNGSTSTRASEFEAFTAGQMHFVFDATDGTLDPTYASSPYAGQFQWATPIRIRGNSPLGFVTQFLGFIYDFRIEYPIRSQAFCSFEALDGLWLLAEHDLAPITANYGLDSVEGRIGRILDTVGWPTGDRDFDISGTLLQSTAYGRTALAEIVDVAQSDGGVVFHHPVDGIRFDGRSAIRTRNSYRTSQKTISDTVEPTFLEGSLVLSGVGDTFRNLIEITPRGLATQSVDKSTMNRPVRGYARELSMETELDADALANFFVDLHGTETPFVRNFTVLAATSVARPRAEILELGVRDRITVTYTTPAGQTVTNNLLINGISHEITPEFWRITYQCESANAYAHLDGPPGSWLALDDVNNRLNTNRTLGY